MPMMPAISSAVGLAKGGEGFAHCGDGLAPVIGAEGGFRAVRVVLSHGFGGDVRRDAGGTGAKVDAADMRMALGQDRAEVGEFLALGIRSADKVDAGHVNPPGLRGPGARLKRLAKMWDTSTVLGCQSCVNNPMTVPKP